MERRALARAGGARILVRASEVTEGGACREHEGQQSEAWVAV
jgi:hypothetical protein